MPRYPVYTIRDKATGRTYQMPWENTGLGPQDEDIAAFIHKQENPSLVDRLTTPLTDIISRNTTKPLANYLYDKGEGQQGAYGSIMRGAGTATDFVGGLADSFTSPLGLATSVVAPGLGAVGKVAGVAGRAGLAEGAATAANWIGRGAGAGNIYAAGSNIMSNPSGMNIAANAPGLVFGGLQAWKGGGYKPGVPRGVPEPTPGGSGTIPMGSGPGVQIGRDGLPLRGTRPMQTGFGPGSPIPAEPPIPRGFSSIDAQPPDPLGGFPPGQRPPVGPQGPGFGGPPNPPPRPFTQPGVGQDPYGGGVPPPAPQGPPTGGFSSIGSQEYPTAAGKNPGAEANPNVRPVRGLLGPAGSTGNLGRGRPNPVGEVGPFEAGPPAPPRGIGGRFGPNFNIGEQPTPTRPNPRGNLATKLNASTRTPHEVALDEFWATRDAEKAAQAADLKALGGQTRIKGGGGGGLPTFGRGPGKIQGPSFAPPEVGAGSGGIGNIGPIQGPSGPPPPDVGPVSVPKPPRTPRPSPGPVEAPPPELPNIGSKGIWDPEAMTGAYERVKGKIFGSKYSKSAKATDLGRTGRQATVGAFEAGAKSGLSIIRAHGGDELADLLETARVNVRREMEEQGLKLNTKPGPIINQQYGLQIKDLIAKTNNPTKVSSIVEKWLGETETPNSAFSKPVKALTGVQSATKLSQFPLSNLPNAAMTVMKGTGKGFMKGLGETISDWKGSQAFAKSTGALRSVVTEPIEGKAGDVIDKAFGISKSEELQRVLASNVGKHTAMDLFEKFKKNPNHAVTVARLKDLLKEDPRKLFLQDALTDKQLKFAGARMSDLTQGTAESIDLPPWWTGSPEANMVTQFKRYSFVQTKLMKDAMKIHPVKTIGTMLTVFPAMGEAVGWSKDQIRGVVQGTYTGEDVSKMIAQARAKRGEGLDHYMNAMGNAWGLGMLQDLYEASQRGEHGLLEAIAGPTAGELSTSASALQKIKDSGNYGPLKRQLLRQVPYIGTGLAGVTKDTDLKGGLRARKPLTKLKPRN